MFAVLLPEPLFLQAQVNNNYTSLIMIALMFGVFYFFIIRPQSRRQKQQEEFQKAIKKGDQVVTNAGIVGRVNKVEGTEGIVTIETGKGVFLDFTIGSVSREHTQPKYGAAKEN